MPMIIANDPTSMMALRVLGQNQLQVQKSTERISSGRRINGAKDDTSSYSISERMKVRLRGLYQDEMNVSTGASMLKVAAGGIENIVTELRTLKEMALNAANDHNTYQDRATLQKDFDQRRADIDDIADTTNYNGKLLLNGTYHRPSVAGSTDKLTMVEPEGTPVTISGVGKYTISNDGVYLISSGYSGTISIQNGASNVKLKQENPSVSLNEVYINCLTNGNMNLWIESLNISNMAGEIQPSGNPAGKQTILFLGENNFLSIKGTNTLTAVNTSSIRTLISPMIGIGKGLTIEGNSTSVLNITSEKSSNWAALIGTSGGMTSYQHASIVIDGGTYNLTASNQCYGAGIGSGGFYTIDDITINKGKLNVALNGTNGTASGAAIGSGLDGGVGNITIGQNVVIDVAVSNDYDTGAGIGSGANGTVGDITIGAGAVVNATSSSRYGTSGAGIGSGAGSIGSWTYGDITISTSASVTASSIWPRPVSYVDDSISTDIGPESSSGNPLILHTGTEASQAIKCYINDMHCKSLGINNTSVNTRDEAVSAIDEIDAAIDYALDEATTIGSYISRLEYTKDNIVTAAENTQASESTIRDADMAKEMTEYTKSNVLAQAAQSMLAQSNQNASNVLSLLSG